MPIFNLPWCHGAIVQFAYFSSFLILCYSNFEKFTSFCVLPIIYPVHARLHSCKPSFLPSFHLFGCRVPTLIVQQQPKNKSNKKRKKKNRMKETDIKKNCAEVEYTIQDPLTLALSAHYRGRILWIGCCVTVTEQSKNILRQFIKNFHWPSHFNQFIVMNLKREMNNLRTRAPIPLTCFFPVQGINMANAILLKLTNSFTDHYNHHDNV